MPLQPELVRSFVAIARENFRLRAAVKTLAAILEIHPPPEQWRELFRQAQKSPEYLAVVNQFEPQLQQLEKAADENEVIQILKQFPPAKFPN